MNFIKTVMSGAAVMIAVSGITSCKDDHGVMADGAKEPNPSQVFSQGIPAQVDGMNITRDSRGLVTLITTREETISFTYASDETRADEFDVIMKVKDNYDGDVDTFYLQLNDMGFVSYAREIDSDSEREDWWFGYNADGQLNYMKRGEGGIEVTKITYTDGDITKTLLVDEDGGGDTEMIEVAYRLNSTDDLIPNKGNIMMFDEIFGVDLDEMNAAYYAGMLGKSTKHLPVQYVEDGIHEETFAWTLNSNGLPVKLLRTMESGQSYEIATFVW